MDCLRTQTLLLGCLKTKTLLVDCLRTQTLVSCLRTQALLVGCLRTQTLLVGCLRTPWGESDGGYALRGCSVLRHTSSSREVLTIDRSESECGWAAASIDE